MAEEKSTQKKEKIEDVKFSGKYLKSIGRRKTSVAQVRLYKKGKGNIIVNEKKLNDYFPADKTVVLTQPLKTTGHLRDLDFSVVVKGGGSSSQAEAIRHGISRALILFEKDLKSPLKSKGWLTRDSRKKERKKPDLKKARKAPQWSKR
jgi:small subunit ribosomal protein S9